MPDHPWHGHRRPPRRSSLSSHGSIRFPVAAPTSCAGGVRGCGSVRYDTRLRLGEDWEMAIRLSKDGPPCMGVQSADRANGSIRRTVSRRSGDSFVATKLIEALHNTQADWGRVHRWVAERTPAQWQPARGAASVREGQPSRGSCGVSFQISTSFSGKGADVHPDAMLDRRSPRTSGRRPHSRGCRSSTTAFTDVDTIEAPSGSTVRIRQDSSSSRTHS